MKVPPLLLVLVAVLSGVAVARARRRPAGPPTPVVGPAVLPSAPPLGAGSSGLDVAVAALEPDR